MLAFCWIFYLYSISVRAEIPGLRTTGVEIQLPSTLGLKKRLAVLEKIQSVWSGCPGKVWSDFDPSKKILLSLYAWPKIESSKLRLRISLHELLGIMRLEKDDYDLSTAILAKLDLLEKDSSTTLPELNRLSGSLGLGTVVCKWPGAGTPILLTIDLEKKQLIYQMWPSNPGFVVPKMYRISTLDVLAPFSNAKSGLGVNLVGDEEESSRKDAIASRIQLISSEGVSTDSSVKNPWVVMMGTSEITQSGHSLMSQHMTCETSASKF